MDDLSDNSLLQIIPSLIIGVFAAVAYASLNNVGQAVFVLGIILGSPTIIFSRKRQRS